MRMGGVLMRSSALLKPERRIWRQIHRPVVVLSGPKYKFSYYDSGRGGTLADKWPAWPYAVRRASRCPNDAGKKVASSLVVKMHINSADAPKQRT